MLYAKNQAVAVRIGGLGWESGYVVVEDKGLPAIPVCKDGCLKLAARKDVKPA